LSALKQLLELTSIDDPYRRAPPRLYELQLAAVRERVAERRQQMRILERRATDAGITEIRSLADAVPLLFADANYKSYPDAFVDQGRWDRMTLWLQTLSTRPITGMDYTHVDGMDGWVQELRRHGHHVMSSSGTSGKQSFLDQSDADREMGWKLMIQGLAWAAENFRRRGERRYPVFLLLPASGSYTATERTARFAEAVGIPGDIHYISNVPQSADELMRLGRLRRAMADGTAKPSEIAELQERVQARAKAVQKDFAGFLDRLLERRQEPMIIMGMMAMLYQVVAAAKERGIADGDFHPDTVISIGGGKKGSNLPADYQEQCHRFFSLGARNFLDGYGMAEMSGFCPISHATGGFAIAPWIVPVVLDKQGEQLLNPANGNGEVEGRFAFIDLLVDARWGGLISGDKVTVDFSPGEDDLKVPLVRNLARYKDLEEGDDKLSCAGTIDAYVRGVIDTGA
jgi:hypothetical protein